MSVRRHTSQTLPELEGRRQHVLVRVQAQYSSRELRVGMMIRRRVEIRLPADSSPAPHSKRTARPRMNA
jgi:hypothetical protein